jgi:U3 small nucleolar RNA-associated protein 3
MAKKRKAPAASKEPQAPSELDARDSRKRITSYKDVADSDDEFHLNQDEVRLGEEPQAKRQRKWAEQEEFLEASDEEVLGYSDEEEDEEMDETVPRKALRKGKGAPSDSEGSDDDRNDGNDDQEMGWGTSKADLYGADDIETEEQALEEEAEALRLQKIQLESMNAADYGLDEDEWQKGAGPADVDEDDDNGVVTEVIPQLHIAADLGPAERLKLLKTRYPEFDLLSQELLRLQNTHMQLAEAAESSPVARIKFRAASAYLGALVMYFCLFTSTASQGDSGAIAMSATQLRDHPVMDSLVKCREVWSGVENLLEDSASSESEEDVAPEDDLADTDAESDVSMHADLQPVRKSRAERHAEATQAANDKRRVERMKRTEADLADLDALIAPSATRKSKASKTAALAATSDDSDLGEEAPLTEREAADKAKRKKSLRFYTSQIAQKANKRGAAGRNAGGDDDIPHRERLRDRQTRLNAEAEKRGKGNADIGADLGGESDEDDRQQAEQIRAHADDDDYYDMVAAKASKKKNDKAALSEAQRQAALQGGKLVQEEVVGQDGKRKISYLIEKNKGLTPHRKKDVRNPRVKKKKKYEEKKKKLASIKPVYKGGEGRGGYGGELTGIKKGLVKSTRL